ncbi:unnamed protein product [Meloidogyne enterolobii]|uniref:Uncharacterized protein n=1 Tax=Meloidogyne enterolobii TaxID=390850 RepID=A0ACB0YJ90_MELEN
MKCCDKNCINTNKPIGNCIKGNGFGNIINDENIKYLVKKGVAVYAGNLLRTQQQYYCNYQNYYDYTLFYFEIKCKFEGELNNCGKSINVGLKNCSTNKFVYYSATIAIIVNEKDEQFKLSTVFNNNDIFGCGLVYPPTNMTNELPYIFFTQNGKQIGKYL